MIMAVQHFEHDKLRESSTKLGGGAAAQLLICKTMSEQSPAIAARRITSCTRETSAFCNEDFKGSMFLELLLWPAQVILIRCLDSGRVYSGRELPRALD